MTTLMKLYKVDANVKIDNDYSFVSLNIAVNINSTINEVVTKFELILEELNKKTVFKCIDITNIILIAEKIYI